MIDYIVAHRIFNSIKMKDEYNGYYLFLEGIKDLDVYPQFLDSSKIRTEVTFGKYNMREIWNLLDKENINNKLAIRDADFIRINGKYITNFNPNIFLTDKHDSECMIINTPTFDKFLQIALTPSQYSKVVSKGTDLRNVLKRIIYNIGCLKLANKQYQLGLIFKPKITTEKGLDFTKFIDSKKLTYLGDSYLIKTVKNFSLNKVDKTKIKTTAEIKKYLDIVKKQKHPIDDIVHGHDFSEIIFFLIRYHFKFNNEMIKNSGNIESMLAMSYDSAYFKMTNLYKEMHKWSVNNSYNIFSI